MQLTFGAIRDGGTPWDRLLDALRDAVVLITPKELAYRLNVQPSYLSDALHGIARKGIKAEWIPVILAMAPDSARLAIIASLAAPCGLEVVRRKDLSPDERLARLEQRISTKFGPAGAELVEENRR